MSDEFPAIECVDYDSVVVADNEDGRVFVSIGEDGNSYVCASPDTARRIATQLLKAARWAEGDRA